jgi:hypothetical protein
MNVISALSHYFHPGSIHKQTVSEGLASEQPIRLLPRMPTDELPPYPEQPAILDGRRRRALDPIWTVVPRDR